MASLDIVRQLGETVSAKATVKSVFGEPIHAEGRTVIPVARVAHGFGGGFGSAHGPQDAGSGQEGEGGGGGGGAWAYPAGALEITAMGTRFISYPNLPWLVGAFGVGMVIGGLWFRRKTPRR